MADYDPLYISFNQKPMAILQAIKDLLLQNNAMEQVHSRRKKIPRLIFFASFLFVLADGIFWLLGYRVCLFSFITPIGWIAALVMGISLRKSRTLNYSPLLQTAQEVIYTLRDDVHPKKNLFGHLDLTGSREKDKLAREIPDAFGRVTQHFRDEWLKINTRLYDGNTLRFSAIKRAKVRKGFWKRSSSGKMKWKPEKDKGALQEFKLKLTLNPNVYSPQTKGDIHPGTRIGSYVIEDIDSDAGILAISARASAENVTSQDILGFLKSAYNLLERRN